MWVNIPHQPQYAVKWDGKYRFTNNGYWSVTKLWCRLINMNTFRVTKQVFLWMMQMAASGIQHWGYDVYRRFNNLNIHYVINARGHVVVRNVIQHILVYLSEENGQQWLAIINTEGARIKLRTNKQFKTNFITEHYIKQIMNRSNWSTLAKCRCGVASMIIETGRFERSVTSIASSIKW